MRSYDNAEAISAAPLGTSDPLLRSLLTDRVHDWRETGLLDFTHLVIVEATDSEDDIIDAIGFSPLINPIDGRRFASDGFVAPWDWLEDHNGWLELMMAIGDGGYALFVMVTHSAEIAAELLFMCRAQAGR